MKIFCINFSLEIQAVNVKIFNQFPINNFISRSRAFWTAFNQKFHQISSKISINFQSQISSVTLELFGQNLIKNFNSQTWAFLSNSNLEFHLINSTFTIDYLLKVSLIKLELSDQLLIENAIIKLELFDKLMFLKSNFCFWSTSNQKLCESSSSFSNNFFSQIRGWNPDSLVKSSNSEFSIYFSEFWSIKLKLLIENCFS